MLHTGANGYALLGGFWGGAVWEYRVYLPRAHARLEGFAECALEEGRYFATLPRNAEEALRMLKQRVRQRWEERACEIQSRMDEPLEPALEHRQYELEVARRLLEKAADEAARETWQIQVGVFETLVGLAERELTGR